MRRIVALALVVGCGDGGNSEDVSQLGGPDGSVDAATVDASLDASLDARADATVDASAPPTQFTFKPSNITLAQLPAQPTQDLRIAASCELDTEDGTLSCSSGGNHAGEFTFAAVDAEQGVRVGILRARSVTIDMAGELLVRGPLPLVLVANERIVIAGRVSGAAVKNKAYAGGFNSPTTKGNGSGQGGGQLGTVGQFTPSGGGSYCGTGGKGALTSGSTGTQASGGTPYGNATLIPLLGGSSGGGAGGEAGAGGGAVQIVSASDITLTVTGVVDVGGGGASNSASAGGSGGAILLEAPSVNAQGTLAANGGGGAAARGGSGGQDGQPSTTPAAGETGSGGEDLDGAGSAGPNQNGEDGKSISVNNSLGGGGGAGRIRVNTVSGTSSLARTLSPEQVTLCATEGTLAPL